MKISFHRRLPPYLMLPFFDISGAWFAMRHQKPLSR